MAVGVAVGVVVASGVGFGRGSVHRTTTMHEFSHRTHSGGVGEVCVAIIICEGLH